MKTWERQTDWSATVRIVYMMSFIHLSDAQNWFNQLFDDVIIILLLSYYYYENTISN